MATNITVDKEQLYEKFIQKQLLVAPPPGSPPATKEQLANANVEIFPTLSTNSTFRRIRWKTKAPVLATEEDDEDDLLGVLKDIVSVGNSAFQGYTNAIGFVDAIGILSRLPDIARNLTDLLNGESYAQPFRVDPFDVMFSEFQNTYYGYVVDSEARWTKSDADDPLDLGTMACQELQDTNPSRLRGRPIKNTLATTDKFSGPLLAAGPFKLRTGAIQTELDVLASVQVDYETFTPGIESFLTVVRAIELIICAGTKEEVNDFLNAYKTVTASADSQRIAEAIDRASKKLEKAIKPPAKKPAVKEPSTKGAGNAGDRKDGATDPKTGGGADKTSGLGPKTVKFAAALEAVPELRLDVLSEVLGVELDPNATRMENLMSILAEALADQ